METIAGWTYFPSRDALPGDLARFVEDYVFQSGTTYDSYLALDPDREYLVADDRSAVLAFVRDGRFLHLPGGLMAPAGQSEKILEVLLEFSRRNRLSSTFYNVREGDAESLRASGFQLTKWGEEPLIHLPDTTWKGKSFEWLRRQENFCLRAGMESREVVPNGADPEYSERIGPELVEVSDSYIAQTAAGREMGTFVSSFDPFSLGRRRLFVAEKDGRIEAFLVCTPGKGGIFWASETYRRRPDSTRGAIPFLMLQTMRALKEEGVEDFSLCLMPGLKADRKTDDNSRLLRRTIVFLRDHLNFLFDVRGINHFKTRFRPDHRDLYVAAHPKFRVWTLLSLIRCWGLFYINPVVVVRRLHSVRKLKKERSGLVDPSRSKRREESESDSNGENEGGRRLPRLFSGLNGLKRASSACASRSIARDGAK